MRRSMSSALEVAVIGAGPWGLNLARAFAATPGARLRWVCDLDAERLRGAGAAHPEARCSTALEEVLSDPAVGAVVVAVDSPRHHAVARRALAADRHVLVEKPLALSVAHAGELCALAAERRRVLLVGHVLLHHPAVLRARALIAAGALGELCYMQAARVAFGTVRAGESAWWSVGPHDVAVALYLFDAVPLAVSATGAAYLQPGRQDVAFATLAFAGGRAAHVQVSWLAPARHRALTVVGTRQMLTIDESAAARPLRLYDRRFEAGPGGVFAARTGEVEAPDLPAIEPLRAECAHFVACVAGEERPRGGGADALAVVRVLEAGERSIRAGGAPVEVT
jgi:predicted dehydrogenase